MAYICTYSCNGRLNGIVELLRTDELNENDCILDLQRQVYHPKDWNCFETEETDPF